MSDLFEVREKTEKGIEWRGTIDIDMDGEEKHLRVRQLRDPEFWEVMEKVDTDELDSMQADIDEETIEEVEELQAKEELTDEEESRLAELTDEIGDDDLGMFEKLSKDTYEGIKLAAKYAVEPDEEDIRTALGQHTEDIREQYGESTNEAAREYLNDHVIAPMIDDSTDFTSFVIGVRALGETLGDSGN